MGYPPDKFDREFDELIVKMDRVSRYAEAQRDFGFPVTSTNISDRLFDIAEDLKNLHDTSKGNSRT